MRPRYTARYIDTGRCYFGGDGIMRPLNPHAPYVREHIQVKKKPLSAACVRLHHEDVRRHLEPFPGFRGVSLHALTSGIEVRIISLNPAPDALVMESLECPGQPFCSGHFEKVLEKELTAIGIPGKWRPAPHPGKKLTAEEAKPPEGYVNEQKRRNLTFHGLRHTFITLGRLAGISDLEIQALARHKSAAMMERYSHASQVLDFSAARDKLEKAIGG
jgi:hypothetical protein